MKSRGYTLVELLVVVAIIAMLAAMIAPVLMQAKDAARMRMCMSNMKQLGIAITRYIDDNNGYGLPQPSAEYRNPWILCVKPLIPNYLPMRSLSPGEQPTLDESIRRVSFFKPPKRIWICEGDTVKGNATNESDKPYWWNFGSSYLYPGPSAYLEGVIGKEFIKANPAPSPRRPMQWKTPKRDVLIADYWFDFHSGL